MLWAFFVIKCWHFQSTAMCLFLAKEPNKHISSPDLGSAHSVQGPGFEAGAPQWSWASVHIPFTSGEISSKTHVFLTGLLQNLGTECLLPPDSAHQIKLGNDSLRSDSFHHQCHESFIISVTIPVRKFSIPVGKQ